MKKLLFLSIALCGVFSTLRSQTIDCAYPIIFLHGWTGNETSFIDVYTDPDFTGIWGPLTDVFHGVMNATDETNIWGADGVAGTNDDDVLVQFVNESNTLAPGCIYAVNLQNFWNEQPTNPVLDQGGCGSPGFTESDGNESAILKQGYALGIMIEKVLDANPDKSKVIVVGHSMGGLMGREYLQRRVPENSTGTPRWWVDPSQADGHKVAKFVTTVTPHRGSNTLGNFVVLDPPEDAPTRDGLPDLASEAVRDLRYSYACGFLGLDDCPGVYLFGGDEDDFISFPYPYWNEDVDCDGDENSPAVIGINISGTTQGTGDEWDGTYDNPNLPLPTDIRYTWITSDIFGDTGDGVVAWSRQWLYNGSTPYPTDGTAHRLTDTLLTDAFHTSANDDPNVVIRGLDEADFPAHSWEVGTDAQFGGVAQRRATFVPDGPATTDPDWFTFETPPTLTNDVEILFTPHPGLAGRIDFFGTSPAPYTPVGTNGAISQTWVAGTGQFMLTLPLGTVNGGTTYYFRVIHESIGYQDWVDPYIFNIQTLPILPLDLLAFDGRPTENGILLDWLTAQEVGVKQFEIERSFDGRSFSTMGSTPALNHSGQQSYKFTDFQPRSGINYYRLKIQDEDQSHDFSQVVAINWESPLAVRAIYPNPVGSAFQVELAIQQDGPIDFNVYDTLGKKIYQRTGQPYGTIYTHYIESEDWPNGWYIIEIRQGAFLTREKLIR